MIKLPEHIKAEMRAYPSSLPPSYLDFHATMAERDLHKRSGWFLIHDFGLTGDGWCDRAKFRRVVVRIEHEDRRPNSTHVLQWHESGAWFEDMGYGSSRFAKTLLTEDEQKLEVAEEHRTVVPSKTALEVARRTQDAYMHDTYGEGMWVANIEVLMRAGYSPELCEEIVRSKIARWGSDRVGDRVTPNTMLEYIASQVGLGEAKMRNWLGM